jgi:hypothetical protein
VAIIYWEWLSPKIYNCLKTSAFIEEATPLSLKKCHHL